MFHNETEMMRTSAYKGCRVLLQLCQSVKKDNLQNLYVWTTISEHVYGRMCGRLE